MSVGTRLPVSLAKKIDKIHSRHRSSNRGWAINDGFASSTPFKFDYNSYDKNSYADMWRMNIELHDAMNEYWFDTVGNNAAQAQFVRWVIESWGGIRGNNAETIENYVHEAINYRTMDGKKGVASYSKMMAAKDCSKNFILDARVAVALNVLQLEYFAGTRYFFDVTLTQNRTISGFNRRYRLAQYTAIGYKPLAENIYSFYNELILKMAKYLGVRGIEVEMMLFDNAENIIADMDAIEVKYQQNVDYWQRHKAAVRARRIERATEWARSKGYI